MVKDWFAYPRYQTPEKLSSFVLDEGVIYLNAIEHVLLSLT